MRADQAIVAVAARQQGVITIAQLLAAGLSHDAVAHRVKRGWLRRWHRGAYLVGPLEVPSLRVRATVNRGWVGVGSDRFRRVATEPVCTPTS